MTACAEVATGFVLVLMLLTAQRSILLCALFSCQKRCSTMCGAVPGRHKQPEFGISPAGSVQL